jgi:hypothetical protein
MSSRTLFPDFLDQPNVHVFVHCHLFMQLDDVRSMLRLPLEDLGLTGGCNFAATATLFNVLLGASQVLYSGRGLINQGERFKAFLVRYYPWEPTATDEVKRQTAGELWEVRHLLAKSLGRFTTRGRSRLKIDKGPLSGQQVDALDTSLTRPSSLAPVALRREPKEGQILSVAGLYWGTVQLLRNFLRDADEVQQAEVRLKAPLKSKRRGLKPPPAE